MGMISAAYSAASSVPASSAEITSQSGCTSWRLSLKVETSPENKPNVPVASRRCQEFQRWLKKVSSSLSVPSVTTTSVIWPLRCPIGRDFTLTTWASTVTCSPMRSVASSVSSPRW